MEPKSKTAIWSDYPVYRHTGYSCSSPLTKSLLSCRIFFFCKNKIKSDSRNFWGKLSHVCTCGSASIFLYLCRATFPISWCWVKIRCILLIFPVDTRKPKYSNLALLLCKGGGTRFTCGWKLLKGEELVYVWRTGFLHTGLQGTSALRHPILTVLDCPVLISACLYNFSLMCI